MSLEAGSFGAVGRFSCVHIGVTGWLQAPETHKPNIEFEGF